MKSSSVLELIVRQAIGIDLFPGESSGYNSSASSVTGDQSPCWGDQASKRLSIVREESNGSADRMATFRPKCRDRIDLDKRKEKLLAVETPRVPSSYSNGKSKTNSNTTIIKLRENETVINNTLIPKSTLQKEHDKQSYDLCQSSREKVTLNQNSNMSEKNKFKINYYNGETETKNLEASGQRSEKKVSNICFVSTQNETKVITVEVHDRPRITVTAPLPPPPAYTIDTNAENKTSDPQNSEEQQSSLSSAISAELKKRAEVVNYN